MHYEITDAKAQDHPAIDALAVEGWQVLKSGYAPEKWESLLLAIGGMSKLSENGRLIVARNSETILGVVAYLPPNASDPVVFPEGWPSIRMLVTRPAYRNMGIGRRLMEACIARAKQDGSACIGLHTSPIMTVALPLYLRMGFVKDRDLEPFAGAPYARYVLYLRGKDRVCGLPRRCNQVPLSGSFMPLSRSTLTTRVWNAVYHFSRPSRCAFWW
ncbi:GCN5-related N-acetyltransferase [Solidesulfovibrio fructosivorans JJ]]|uniref:GCN5-related N-acetyltransferase n=1 Tax=Solidesulfovibrio fructosivorans JJ] TaxID=596151 RepID=E1JU61_SOLFR|nr:GCN5-related N-acetyltransferase [Solidesulfovibrio fructosivorans JJ]]